MTGVYFPAPGPDPLADLQSHRYQVIYADPPWSYNLFSEKGYEKSPEAHYQTMSYAELCALNIKRVAAPNCILIMWSTWPHLPQAMALMAVWGFEYKTGGSWHKQTKNGKSAFGGGFIYRSATEPYLLGTIGKPFTVSKSVRNVIVTEVENFPSGLEALRGGHSEKPLEMRNHIDQLCPNAQKIELFAREPWPGQDVWGDQPNLRGAE